MGGSEHCPKGMLGRRLNRKRDKGRNFRVKGLGRAKGEEIGKEAGGMGRGHRGTRDCVGCCLGPNPSREDIQT